MKNIVQAPGGFYVDLSKIVAVSAVFEVPQNFKEGRGFDIYFTPEGIPFKEDNCFKIKVFKAYERPSLKDFRNNHTDLGFTEEGLEILHKFQKKCTEEMEQERVSFVRVWEEYKNLV